MGRSEQQRPTGEVEPELFETHPAFGLRPGRLRKPRITQTEQLGFRWLRLSAAEQRRRQTCFFRVLLNELREPAATFWARLPDAQERSRLSQIEGVTIEDGMLTGPLTPDAVGVLIDTAPDELAVTVEGEACFLLRDGWHGAGAWLTASQIEALRPKLEACRSRTEVQMSDAEMDIAAPEAGERPTLAVALLATIYGTYAVALGVGLVVLRVAEDNGAHWLVSVATALAAVVLVLVALSPVRRLGTRWYAHSGF